MLLRGSRAGRSFTITKPTGRIANDYKHQGPNCNDNKGMESVCNKTRSSSYALSGGRKMLPETRTLIYMRFWEECKIWAAEFGVIYADCLNVIERTHKNATE